MFSELCRETLRRAVASGYLGYIISLRDQLALDQEEEEQEEDQGTCQNYPNLEPFDFFFVQSRLTLI